MKPNKKKKGYQILSVKEIEERANVQSVRQKLEKECCCIRCKKKFRQILTHTIKDNVCAECICMGLKLLETNDLKG